MKNNINLFDKFLQKIGFPQKKESDEEYLKIKKTDYELMKKMAERQDNFATQIIKQNKIIEENAKIIELNNKALKEKVREKRKLNGKIGGMQKQINALNRKNIELVNEIARLKKISDNMSESIALKDKEIAMLKNKGKKKKDIETYKNYFQARKELEKREKNE